MSLQPALSSPSRKQPARSARLHKPMADPLANDDGPLFLFPQDGAAGQANAIHDEPVRAVIVPQ
jgi:hypothetical protein